MYKRKQFIALLFSLLVGLAAGRLAWESLSCEPYRTVPVPAGTCLLRFSPGGRYVVTWDSTHRLLILRDLASGREVRRANLSPKVDFANGSFEVPDYFFNISGDDRWLAIVQHTPDDLYLELIDLAAVDAKPNRVRAVPPPSDLYSPQPLFHANGRYLSYQLPGERAGVFPDVVLYDIAERRELVQIPNARAVLGQVPGHPEQWLVHTYDRRESIDRIERWEVVKRRKLASREVRLYPEEYEFAAPVLASDGTALLELAMTIATPPPKPPHRVTCFRHGFSADAAAAPSVLWERQFPSPIVNYYPSTSWPPRFLLIRTLDEKESLVEELIDIETGQMLTRFPQPLNMTMIKEGPVLIQTVGSEGDLAIDASRQVLVSKQFREPFLWRNFPALMNWLRLAPPPAQLSLQWYSARTGDSLEHANLTMTAPVKVGGEPKLAVHPTEPILALIDGGAQGDWQLQFWAMPPSRPWGWIIAVSLVATVLTRAFIYAISWLWRTLARWRFRKPGLESQPAPVTPP